MSSPKTPEEKHRELLIEEYKLCHAGYLTRDQMVQDEFTKIIRSFSLLLTILVALNAFVRIHAGLHTLLTLVVGVTGLLAMLALLIDLQSTSSAKIALRKRSLQIEREIADPSALVLWKCIDDRKKFREEEVLKGASSHIRDQDETEGDLFIVTSRVMILLWIVVSISLGVYGQGIQLK